MTETETISTTLTAEQTPAKTEPQPEDPIAVITTILTRFETAKTKKREHEKFVETFDANVRLLTRSIEEMNMLVHYSTVNRTGFDLSQWSSLLVEFCHTLKRYGWADIVAGQLGRPEELIRFGYALLSAPLKVSLQELDKMLRGRSIPEGFDWRIITTEIHDRLHKRRKAEERIAYPSMFPG